MSPNIFHISPSAVISLKVKVDQSSPTLYDPKDYTVHRILQAKKLEWKEVSAPCQVLPSVESGKLSLKKVKVKVAQ